MSYKLVFSPVFKITLKILCNFLTRKYSQDLALKTKLVIRKGIEKKLPGDPFIGPVGDRLLNLGAAGYHQLIIDKHNAVLYSIDKEHQKIII